MIGAGNQCEERGRDSDSNRGKEWFVVRVPSESVGHSCPYRQFRLGFHSGYFFVKKQPDREKRWSTTQLKPLRQHVYDINNIYTCSTVFSSTPKRQGIMRATSSCTQGLPSERRRPSRRRYNSQRADPKCGSRRSRRWNSWSCLPC